MGKHNLNFLTQELLTWQLVVDIDDVPLHNCQIDVYHSAVALSMPSATQVAPMECDVSVFGRHHCGEGVCQDEIAHLSLRTMIGQG